MSSSRLICTISTIFALYSVAVHAYDYCDALHKSLLFYEAQRSGRLPSSNRVPWRGNSALSDCTSISCIISALTGDGNLAGGYYDAGDGVKFMFPASFTTTTLAWGFIEFSDAIAACGETQNYLNTIQWSTDFIMDCHTSELEFWGQIGNGGMDHSFWGPPEKMTMGRPTYKISASAPGTELALEAASALAAASIAFKSSNPSYSATLISHARQLYKLGYNYRGFYSDSIPDAANYYKSYGYNDEVVWGSIWLYRATGEASFLNAAKSDYVQFNMKFSAPGQSFDWDQKAPGVVVNMYRATGDPQYLADAQSWMNSWYRGNGITYTPGGLAWLRQWGPLRYTAGSAFLALVIANSQSNSWAKGQIDYMLGSNPSQRSYVCGFGNNPPINPHHRAAHGSTTFNIDNPVNNLHILTGALVGGPDANDYYVDDRHDYIKNEVAIDYNAAFTGALAALAKLSGQSGSNPQPTSLPTTAAPVPTKPVVVTTSTTTTSAPAPPISQATSRPTSAQTSAPTSTPQNNAGQISIQLSSSSSTWWFAVAVLNGGAATNKVEFTDSGIYQSYTAMQATNWGYWTFSPSAELKVPISLRITSQDGNVITLTTLINSLTQFSPIPTGRQYGQSSSTSTRNAPSTPQASIPQTQPQQQQPTQQQQSSKQQQPTQPQQQPTIAENTLKLKVHQGSSVWWAAFAVLDSTQDTSFIIAKDAAGKMFNLQKGEWGYWILTTSGTPVSLPLTLTTTSSVSQKSIDFAVASLTADLVVDSRTQY